MWKSELCFAREIDPWRKLEATSDEEALGLVALAREAMPLSARDGMQARPRSVYKRAGRPCEVEYRMVDLDGVEHPLWAREGEIAQRIGGHGGMRAVFLGTAVLMAAGAIGNFIIEKRR